MKKPPSSFATLSTSVNDKGEHTPRQRQYAFGCVLTYFYVERYAKVLKKSNMRKSEIFNTVLDVVAAETEVSHACILSRCKRREVVDARHMLCRSLMDQGMTVSDVAERLRCTRRNVEKIEECFDDRMKGGGRVFEFVFERITKILRKRFERSV